MSSGALPTAEPPAGAGEPRALDPQDRRRAARVEPHAIVTAAVLTAVWAWWAWKQGAYFGTILLPGTVLLCGTTILLALTAPVSMRLGLNPPARVALAAIVALACWTLASSLWSPAPDVAVADAQRVFTYALAFGLGLWLCSLAGRRLELPLAPLAIAGGGVALAAALTLSTGTDVHRYLEVDGTVQFPLGYRNANGAFFCIAFWPALGLATMPGLRWWGRGLALGAATLCLNLALLAQSRGSTIAMAAAVLVYLFCMPHRTTALGWLVLAAAPSVLVVGHLSPLYHDALNHRPLLDELHSAASAAIVGGAVAAVIGAAVARVGGRAKVSRTVAKRFDRGLLVALIVLPLAGIAAFTLAIGSPITWIGQRVEQFNRGQNTSIEKQPTRFGFNTGTGRGDFWRIALLQARRHPLLGDGAGGYHFAYLRERHNPTVTVRDAHSVELETLSELGVPGFALLLTAFVGAALGIRRARRLGPSAAALGAVAFAACSYWLVHSSIDWFWPYPAVTAPVVCLAGAACAPALRTLGQERRGLIRQLMVSGAMLLALSAIPPFLSQRYVDAAYGEWRQDLPAAYSDLDAAARWNPLSEEPSLAKGVIARSAGDRRRAIDAFTQAVRDRPEDWAPHYYLASLYSGVAPRRARAEVAAGLRLDPKEPALHALRRRLASARKR